MGEIVYVRYVREEMQLQAYRQFPLDKTTQIIYYDRYWYFIMTLMLVSC